MGCLVREKTVISAVRRYFLPMLVLIFVGLVLLLCGRRVQTEFPELRPEDGVADLRNADFAHNVYHLVNSWAYYPGALYTPEDFADPETAPEKDDDAPLDPVKGTWRLRLLAEPDTYLSLCHFSIDYSTRIFVNGKELRNIGRLLHGDLDYVKNEIAKITELAHDNGAIVKVIIETCYLSDEQKVTACRLSEEAGADFVKTSTGYGSKGCTIEDLKLMRKSVSPSVRVKGSGGIRDLDTVLKARAAGADRCGVSATEKIMAEAEARFAEGKLEEISAD